MAGSPIAQVILLITAAIAGYCIVGIQIQNGTFNLLDKHTGNHPVKLPGTEENLKLSFTGVKVLDQHLGSLMMFFWPFANGDFPQLSIFGFYLTGQLLSTETLMLLEGHRAGNLGKVVSYTTIWGAIYQLSPWGMIVPLYSALHLWTSPIAQFSKPTTSRLLKNSISIDPLQLLVLPVALMLGYIIPTVLGALPSPSFTSFAHHQNYISFWQAFPIWIALIQLIFTNLIPVLIPSLLQTWRSSPRKKLKLLRKVYMFALPLTAAIHITTILLVIYPRLMSSFFSATALSTINLSTVFLPISPFSTNTVSLFQGFLNLLQYDMYFACGASLIWVVQLYASSSLDSGFSTLCKVLVLNLFLGPGGAALALIWARDENVFRDMDVLDKNEKDR